MIQAHREDGIPIVNEKSVRMTAWQSFAKLLECPFGGWMGCGHIEMQQAARANLQGDEDVQNSETGSNHGQEVASDDCLRVVADECGPMLRGGATWTGRATKILVNSARRDINSEFQ